MVAKRLESLDVVRGLAALTVVLNHWKLFYWPPGGNDDTVDINSLVLPFGRVSWFFLKHGALAVDLFFCLSGFIFFYLYRTPIENGGVSARSFAVLRLSRLYPLHFVTLLIVAALGLAYQHRYGVAFGLVPNDALHFVLHLGFASDWWPSPNTFNGPIWSVSIEVLLYILFFAAAKSGVLMSVEAAAAISIAGFILLPRGADLGSGIAEFYAGGLACCLVQAISTGKVPRRLTLSVLAVVAASLAVRIMTGVMGYSGWFLMAVAFPGLIAILALLEHHIERWVRPFRWLGKISYSTYLLHFPMMFIVILLGWSAYAPSRIFSFGFMVVLIALSLASFYRFEYPVQQWIRRKMSVR